MNSKSWMTHSLQASPLGEWVIPVLMSAIQAVDPTQAVKRALVLQDNRIIFGDRTYNLEDTTHLWVVAIGKAGLPMAYAVEEILGELVTGGVVLTKQLHSHQSLDTARYQVLIGGHPVPDIHSLDGSQAILDLLSETRQDDLVIFLISGGGSALLTSPAEDLSITVIQALTSTLLSCGANINQINTLRKHLSQVKGGQLARWAAPSQAIALVLSDVIGDPLDVIASGPTVPDPTTYQEALDIMDQYQIRDSVPSIILGHLNRGVQGEIPETPKPGDPIFKRVCTQVIGNNYTAARAAADQARQLGFNTAILSTFVQGEARGVGRLLAGLARQVVETGEPLPKPACIILGGETTVTLRGKGLGGRNQEVALSTVTDLSGLAGTLVVTLATDGEDGPTDAAGAVVSGQTLERATGLGLDPAVFLDNNDAYHFFEPLGDLLRPGPTGTNVCDLNFIFVK